jgi:proline iminopeptidase
MYAKVNGTRIFFDVNGKQFVPDGDKMKKKPVCFVLHGGPGGDHSVYVPALDPITEYMQLVYIDWRGNGRSDYPDESTYTIKQNVEDLEALRQYLGLDKIVILGQSYGGFMGQAYATAYPENLHGLILTNTAPNYQFLSRAQEELRKRGTPEQIEIADKYFWPGKFPNIMKNFTNFLCFSPTCMRTSKYQPKTSQKHTTGSSFLIRRSIWDLAAI